MRRLLVFALLPVTMALFCHDKPPTGQLAQWQEIEQRYVEFAEGYRLQQAMLRDAYAGIWQSLRDTTRTDTLMVAQVSLCAMLQRRGIPQVNCESTVDTTIRPSIGRCMDQLNRCEASGPAPECSQAFRRCIGAAR